MTSARSACAVAFASRVRLREINKTMLRRRIFWSVLAILVLTAGAFAQSRDESRLETETANPPKAGARELIAGRKVPSAAPLNPRYLEYLKERAQGRVRRMATADGH